MNKMPEPKSILILYGSQSGNSEEIAIQAGKSSTDKGLNPTVRGMDEIDISLIKEYTRLLICCSTWGDGEQPDNAEDLWEAANSGTISSLEGLNFSVLALGDTSYDLFCESGKEWDKWLESKGANRVLARVDCDVDFEEPAEEWTKSVLEIMSKIEDGPVMEVSGQEEDAIEITAPESAEKDVKNTSTQIPAKSEWSAKNPFSTTISDNYVLNGEGSRKETRHIVFQLKDSGLTYKAGDALGVVPQCPPDLVNNILSLCGFSGREEVDTHLGVCTIREALTNRYEIHRISKKWIKGLYERAGESSGKVEIRIVGRKRYSSTDGSLILDWEPIQDSDLPEGYVEIGDFEDNSAILLHELTSDTDSMEDYIWSRDYVDALDDFSSLGFTAQQLIDGMDRLKPRLYSIASSPDFESGTVHLTVAIVRYNHHNRDRTGLCTGFMADRCETNTTQVGVYMSPTRSFVLPEDGSKDIIMVGPGTGIAPFRAFLQQREIDSSSGRNWLFFGDWTEEGEYLYRDEMEDWKERGIITRQDLAWSREGDEKVYVQHLMEKNGEEIWNWIENGAYFYVCGDKQYMAKDVHTTLIEICVKFGNMTPVEAKDFVETGLMKTEKRYLRDVY